MEERQQVGRNVWQFIPNSSKCRAFRHIRRVVPVQTIKNKTECCPEDTVIGDFVQSVFECLNTLFIAPCFVGRDFVNEQLAVDEVIQAETQIL